ncbi:MAG TPA: caspase family protein [Micropepsaceae bacterium]|nr:caspase family protein [Micropepsaceae bacterium]
MGSYALLVGVSKFDDLKLAKLTAPQEDVEALAAVLRDPTRGGFDNVETCIDADLQTIREQLSALLDDRRPDDTVLFYYSGHGIMAKGQRLFLATGRSSFDRPQISSLWASEMRELLELSRAAKQVVILDCCHSGGFAEGAKGVATPITDETFGDGEGQYVLTATDALQFAYDTEGALREGVDAPALSRFTSWLVDGIGKGEAAPEKDQITLDALFEYVERRARAASVGMTPKLFVKRKSGELIIARNPAVRPRPAPINRAPEPAERVVIERPRISPKVEPPISESAQRPAKVLDKPALTPSSDRLAQTPIGAIRRWLSERPAYLLAFGLPPLLFATWHLFRLPIPSENAPIQIFIGTGVLFGFALWFKNRVGAILAALPIGLAFVVKPAVVPFEGFVDDPLPYWSATAEDYWWPGAFFVIVVAAIGLTAAPSRLLEEVKRLRPDVAAFVIAVATGLAGYFYFDRPTLYDVYLPFRPQYAQLREHLVAVAAAVDRVASPFAPSKPLDIPLVLDETGNIRDENPSATGHLFLYQHLTMPDARFGGMEDALDNDLLLDLRDTGKKPVLSASAFAEYASAFRSDDAAALARTLNAPYLVIVKPFHGDSTEVQRAAPYRVFLYNLKRDEIIFAADIQNPVGTADELKEQANSILEMTVGAKILRRPAGVSFLHDAGASGG